MAKLLRNDWFKIAVFLFAMGGFAARSNSTGNAVADHSPRIAALEKASIEHTAALVQIAESNRKAIEALERINVDLQNHKVMDAADTARIEQALEEIDRLRDHQ